MKELSWTPVRRGAKYCAPACGRGCTFREFRLAHVTAESLARKLAKVPTDITNREWEVRVYENLGWWWSISKGLVTIHPNGGEFSKGFHLSLNIAGPWGGNLVIYSKYADAERGVRELLSIAAKELEPLVELNTRLKAVAA